MSPQFGAIRSFFLIVLASFGLAACGGGGGGGNAANDSGGGNTDTSSPPTRPQVLGFTIGGTVAGLRGSGLVLDINGGNQLSVAASGSFAFSKAFPNGSSYSVSVVTQPGSPVQTCRVTNGVGTISSANVSNVAVDCITEISDGNIDGVLTDGSALLELLPQLAEFVGARLTFLRDHLSAQASESCPDPNLVSPGQVRYDYFDADRDGTLSATDTVTVTLNNCFSQSIGDYVTTVVDVTVGAPPQPMSYRSGFSANVTFRDFSAFSQRLNGRIGVVYTDADEMRVLRTEVAGSSLSLTSDNIARPMDTVTVASATVSKTLDYVAARYSLGGAITFSSPLLQGQFSLSTPIPLGERFGIYPSLGAIDFRAGRAAVRLAAQNISDNHAASTSVAFDNSSSFSERGFISWDAYFRGFSWYETRYGKSFFGRPQDMTRTRDAWFFNLISAEPLIDPANLVLGTNLDVDTPIKLFYTAPVDLTRTTLMFRRDEVSIPAVVVVNGAIATVTAERQLEHGAGYELSAVDGLVFTPGRDMGTTFNQLGLSTRNNLQADGAGSPAVASPGQTVMLRSPRSFSLDSAISSTRWSQRSGTLVQLMNQDAATASFVVPMSASNGEALGFDLTVTDANGETDTVPVTVFVLTDLSQPFLYYRRAQGSNVGLAPEKATLRSALQGVIATEFRFDREFDFFLNLSTPTGPVGLFDSLRLWSSQALDVGTYPLSITTAVDIFGVEFSCNEPVGQFVIHEIRRGPENEVLSFAADFERGCGVGTAPLIGSVRVNSLVPLP